MEKYTNVEVSETELEDLVRLRLCGGRNCRRSRF